jgi:hypothetical protein
MLVSLTIENYRCFRSHQIPFRPLTVVVGRNNAGKSSLVEALRLVGLVVSKARSTSSYRVPPGWTGLPIRYAGVLPSTKNLGIGFDDAIFYQYGGPPGKITASFKSGLRAEVYVGRDGQVFGLVVDPTGRVAGSRARVVEAGLPPLAVMPQVTPVQKAEEILDPDYVKGAMSSTLSPLHFRNELNILFELFPLFQRRVQETWPGVKVEELVGHGSLPHTPLSLLVRNEDFTAEIAQMGDGLQVWLQVIWFLTRSAGASAFILDEPDVYMHADLQRRLVRFLARQPVQTILTSHSVELLSEVSPAEILVIDRRRLASRFADSLRSVQQLMERMGGTQNIHLTRLWHSRRVLLVEGEDLKLLKQLHDKVCPDARESLDAIPNCSIGGWGGWPYAVGSSMVLQNALDEEITPYCLLDRDYHTQGQVDTRLAEATEKHVQLHIWRKKELENYFLVPAAIKRLLRRQPTPSDDEVLSEIDRIACTLKTELIDNLATAFQEEQRRDLTAKTANEKAREEISARLAGGLKLRDVVSGKELLSKLSAVAQTRWGASLSAMSVARQMRPEEVEEEVVLVLEAIEAGRTFSDPGGSPAESRSSDGRSASST